MTTPTYTTEGAAKFLGGDQPISKRTLEYWRQTGKGPAFVKMGKHVRYEESALIAFRDAQRRQSTSEAA